MKKIKPIATADDIMSQLGMLCCAHLSIYEDKTDTEVPHQHAYTQILYVVKGVIRIQTPEGYFVVPPSQAIWIPPHVDHSVTFTGRLECANLYFSQEFIVQNLSPPKDCKLFHVDQLLRELCIKMCVLPKVAGDRTLGFSIAKVILGLIQFEPHTKFKIVRPQDKRLLKIVKKVERDLGNSQTLEELAPFTGASHRTLSRLFHKELHMSFSHWRGQLRIFRALELLAQGISVTSVGMEVGFESTSSFISYFKKVTGKTPLKYFKSAHDE